MKKSRLISILLCLCMALGILSGCGDTSTDNTGTDSSGDSGTITLDYDTAYAKHDPDDVVLKVNGDKVTWGEYFYWLYYAAKYNEYYYSGISSWSDMAQEDNTKTNDEYMRSYAEDAVVQYHVIAQMAEDKNITLSDDDKATLQSEWDGYCEQYGSEEAFLEYLTSIYTSREVYDFVEQTTCLYYDLFYNEYGEDGSKCPDKTVEKFVSDKGYMQAKHILIKTTDSDGNALSDDEKAQKLATAQDLLNQINSAGDHAAKFNELYSQYNEDTGAQYYPDGYLFVSGDMVEAFETAVTGLKENQISEVVESDYGYHIILRLPVNYNSVAQYQGEDSSYTLRYLAAATEFTDKLNSEIESAKVSYKWGFKSLSMEKLFS